MIFPWTFNGNNINTNWFCILIFIALYWIVHFSTLVEGEQCLAKYDDGVWYKATIRFLILIILLF